MSENKKTTLSYRFRKYLFSGLATVVPLFITFYFVYLVFRLTDNFAGNHINAFLSKNYGFYVP